MQTTIRWPHAAAVAAVIASLSGCGGSATLAPSSSDSSLQRDLPAALAASGDLLYVANDRASDGVSVLTFPQGRLIARIKQLGGVRGICSDNAGNVWMATFSGRGPFHVYEFSHGGTKPIAELNTRHAAYGCAVDSTTGDLAIVSYGGSEDGIVDIWRGARQDRHVMYYIGIPPAACAYDNGGNLFIDGAGSVGVALVELRKGSKFFTNDELGSNAGWTVGSVQWDGTDVAVGAGTISGPASLYRVRVSGERGKIVDIVHLQHLAGWPHFAIVNGEVVATQRGSKVRRAGLYAYPGGGKALHVFSGLDDPVGITVSLGARDR